METGMFIPQSNYCGRREVTKHEQLNRDFKYRRVPVTDCKSVQAHVLDFNALKFEVLGLNYTNNSNLCMKDGKAVMI